MHRLHRALVVMNRNNSQANASLLQATFTATLYARLKLSFALRHFDVHFCMIILVDLKERLTS